ncbi:cation diffusion facilitator family transporter [Streptomyces sp. NPDC049590]|uniref:cation diffusion facilitator family transporter n=1 Tax=Streptomyces sp. NPDC049590 TaxID=3154834 RepID=UPI003435570C
MSGTSSNRETTAARTAGSNAHRTAHGAPSDGPRPHAGPGGPPDRRDADGGHAGPEGHPGHGTGRHTAPGADGHAARHPGPHAGPRTPQGTGSGPTGRDTGAGPGAEGDRSTRVTVLVALAANLVIAVAKGAGGVLAGSPALLSEAAHSVADSLNEVFLLAALRRSRRPADTRHPFGYGKERFFWSLLAAVGIFVMGGCFSFFQGIEALRGGAEEEFSGYVAGLIVLGVALAAEAGSLLRALYQVRRQGGGLGGLRDPALRTVVAEDGTAVLGVTFALIGMALHMVTGQVVWEASASLVIGVLLVYVAYRLGRDARDQLIGEAADPELSGRIRALLRAQPEIDSVEALFTMKLGLDSTLVAARVDLVPGLDSERVEKVADRIKRSLTRTFPDAGQVFLDVTDRRAGGTRESPAATGERGGA